MHNVDDIGFPDIIRSVHHIRLETEWFSKIILSNHPRIE